MTSGSNSLKFAEKLTILNDRTIGLMTRLYNIKKACFDPKLRPKFLYEKPIDAAVKALLKKFPQSDLRNNQNTFENVRKQKLEIMKALHLYYTTFIDVLDLKDHIMELFTKMNMSYRSLDITLNFDLTLSYLNLVSNYISLMILMSRIDDRKAVLSMFNLCHEMTNGCNEPSYPRMGQMIVDFDNPYKKLNEDFSPVTLLIKSSLISVSKIYGQRNIVAETWRNANLLSLTNTPSQLLSVAQTETMNCELLSMDQMEQWIVLSCLICPNNLLNDITINTMWSAALQTSIVVKLFRDEVLHIHPTFIDFFESMKSSGKKVSEVKELHNIAIQTAPTIHQGRRKFLREALRDLALLYEDEPGILGPKILFALMGMAYARDEINWYLRHFHEWPQSVKKQKIQGFGSDRQLPELIFYVLQLRTLTEKYGKVVSNYYFKYIKNNGLHAMGQYLPQVLDLLKRDDGARLQSIADSMCETIKPNKETYDDVKLDWFRIQANASAQNYGFDLGSNRKLVVHINTIVFHFRLIGDLNSFLMECSSLENFVFYPDQLKDQFEEAKMLTNSTKYCISYPKMTADFENCLHEMCPEEHDSITKKSYNCCTLLLEDIGKRLATLTFQMINTENELNLNASALRCAELIDLSNKAPLIKGQQRIPDDVSMAGTESLRIHRDSLTIHDKQLNMMIELVNAVQAWESFRVFDNVFVPRDYVITFYEKNLISLFMMRFFLDNEKKMLARPSDLLSFVNSELAVLQLVERSLGMDLQKLFTAVLCQETLTADIYNNETFTSLYIKYYVAAVLKKASNGSVQFSPHTFTFTATHEYVGPLPEHYTDPAELRALATLIGPFGVKTICDHIVWQTAAQIMELIKLTISNKMVLQEAKRFFTNPGKIKEILDRLGEHENEPKKKGQLSASSQAIHFFINRLTIVGILMSFKKMLYEAGGAVFKKRLQFMHSHATIMYKEFNIEQKIRNDELFSALALEKDVDMLLVNLIEQEIPSLQLKDSNEIHLICNLLLVFAGLALPRLSAQLQSAIKTSNHSMANNATAVPVALDSICSVLFTICGTNDQAAKMREFLTIMSCGLLQIVGCSDHEHCPNLKSINIILEDVVKESSFLTYDDLQAVFPYNLISSSYSVCYNK
uniref:Membrane-associated protein Hem n=1 Tax=Rhabditophanes sp. KR3021 TaxID=114890 RepID=A0AC35TYM5_9BILA